MHSMQSVDAPVAPVAVDAAPPPPETPAPLARDDASQPSQPKKTRISLDPAEDPQLPGGVEAGFLANSELSRPKHLLVGSSGILLANRLGIRRINGESR